MNTQSPQVSVIKPILFCALCAVVVIACSGCSDGTSQEAESLPDERGTSVYTVDGTTILEWRDDWGRLCTAVRRHGNSALSCSFPLQDDEHLLEKRPL